MSKRKNNAIMELLDDRYFVWALVCIAIVAIALLAQISLSRYAIDSDIAAEHGYMFIHHRDI